MNTEILNKYIELINKGYCEDCNELNCIGNFPHKEIAKNIKDILEENQQLKEQLNKYTDPKDLTLMFMYCDEKAKDKIKCLEQENQQLKEQIEKCQLQNFNLKQDIMIKKISFPNKKIRDKSLIELYNMPSYEDLKRENQQLKDQLDQKDNIINKAIEFINKYNGSTWYQISISIISELLELLDNKGKDI